MGPQLQQQQYLRRQARLIRRARQNTAKEEMTAKVTEQAAYITELETVVARQKGAIQQWEAWYAAACFDNTDTIVSLLAGKAGDEIANPANNGVRDDPEVEARDPVAERQVLEEKTVEQADAAEQTAEDDYADDVETSTAGETESRLTVETAVTSEAGVVGELSVTDKMRVTAKTGLAGEPQVTDERIVAVEPNVAGEAGSAAQATATGLTVDADVTGEAGLVVESNVTEETGVAAEPNGKSVEGLREANVGAAGTERKRKTRKNKRREGAQRDATAETKNANGGDQLDVQDAGDSSGTHSSMPGLIPAPAEQEALEQAKVQYGIVTRLSRAGMRDPELSRCGDGAGRILQRNWAEYRALPRTTLIHELASAFLAEVGNERPTDGRQ